MTSALRRLSVGIALLASAFSSSVGCSHKPKQDLSRAGQLKVALRGISNSGAEYRLRNATFHISGNSEADVSSDSDPQVAAIAVQLAPGNYQVEILPGWYLEKARPDGTFVAVDAVLVSDNPIAFTIVSLQTTSVQFRFTAGPEVIPVGDGTLTITIAVDDSVGGGGGAPQGGSGGGSGTGGALGTGGTTVASVCAGSTPSNPKVLVEFLPAHNVKWIEAILPIPSNPGQFWVATQQQGSYCGGGTPVAMWKVTVEPSGGPAKIEHQQDLSRTVSIRTVLFRSSDGTLFTGGGWCGYNPPYYSVDNGATWLPADSGAVHPPNNTFSIVEFQGSVYVGTGYTPYAGDVYRWLGAGNWALAFHPTPQKHIVVALGVFKNRLFVGTSPGSGCSAGDVPIYVSSNGSDFSPTAGLPGCTGVSMFTEADSTLYAWVGSSSGRSTYRWNESAETWELVATYSLNNPSDTAMAALGNTTYFGLAGANASSLSGIYATSDSGTTWTLLVAAPQPSVLRVFDRTLFWSGSGAETQRIFCLEQ